MDTTLNNATTTSTGLYTLTYQAASAGQRLTVTFTQANATSGNVTIQTAALAAAPTPDYSISATPATQTVTPGAGTSYTVTVSPISGFNGDVALSVNGLPSGATGTFSPASIVGGNGASTLTVTTDASTPLGSPTLTITGTAGPLTHSAGVTVAVQAAPDFTLGATPATRTVTPGAGTSYTVTIAPTGGFTGDVTLAVTGLPAGATGTVNPPTVLGGSGTSTLTVTTSAGTPLGSVPLTITGTAGALSHSAEVTLAVNASIAGSLGGTLTTPAGTQNLSTLGTLDWAHWGLSSATSFHHKAGITPQISNVSVVGGGTPFAYGNHPFGFSWSGGTPTASATASSTGIFISGVNNGFQITAPADTTSRTLTVYVGVWRAQGRLVAHLSDNAAPDYVDTTLNNGAGTTPGLYTVVYQAASAGQTLTITYTQANVTSGNVTLQAATLR